MNLGPTAGRPRPSTPSVSPRETSADIRSRDSEGGVVLVIEPSPLVRHGVHRRLFDHPMIAQLRTTPTSEDGRRLAAELNPDVIVLSALLPGEPIALAVRQLRKLNPEGGVIVTSGPDDADTLLSAIEAGAHGYLTLRASLDDLTSAVESVYRGESALPPGLLRAMIDRIARLDGMRLRAVQRLSRLTRRERHILSLVADGKDNAEIARQLGISPLTVRTHVHRVLTKLEVHSRLEAMTFVVRHQLGGELIDG